MTETPQEQLSTGDPLSGDKPGNIIIYRDTNHTLLFKPVD